MSRCGSPRISFLSIFILLVIISFLDKAKGKLVPTLFMVAVVGASIYFTKRRKDKREMNRILERGLPEHVEELEIVKKGTFLRGDTAEKILDLLGEPQFIVQLWPKENKTELWRYCFKSRTAREVILTMECGKLVHWEVNK